MFTIMQIPVNKITDMLFELFTFNIFTIYCIRTRNVFNTIIHFRQILLSPPPTTLPNLLYLWFIINKPLKVLIPLNIFFPMDMWKMEWLKNLQCSDYIRLWNHVFNQNCAIKGHRRKCTIKWKTLKPPPVPIITMNELVSTQIYNISHH